MGWAERCTYLYAIDNLLDETITVDYHSASQQVGSWVQEFGLAVCWLCLADEAPFPLSVRFMPCCLLLPFHFAPNMDLDE